MAKTVDHVQKATQEARKQFDDQLAVDKATFIQLKVEFEKYKTETIEKLN